MLLGIRVQLLDVRCMGACGYPLLLREGVTLEWHQFLFGLLARCDVAGAALEGLLCSGVCWTDPQEDPQAGLALLPKLVDSVPLAPVSVLIYRLQRMGRRMVTSNSFIP